MSLSGEYWRKSADGMESLDVITDVDRVRYLNNPYFAPVIWLRGRSTGRSVGSCGEACPAAVVDIPEGTVNIARPRGNPGP